MTPSRMLPLLALPLALAACSADRIDAPSARSPLPAAPVEQPAPPAGDDGAADVPDGSDGGHVVDPVADRPATPPVEPAASPAERPGYKAPAQAPTQPRSGADIVDEGSGASAGRWTLRMTLRTGDVVTGTVVAEPRLRPTVLGVTDADRDGDDEVFVRIAEGASTSTYVAFTLVEDGLAEVRTTTGDALRLVVGGGVRHGDGFLCEPDSITTLAAASDDGVTYRGTSTSYSWRDDVVTETRRGSFSGGADDPAIRAAYGIDCNTLQQG